MFAVLNIHKPRGPTSRDVVNRVQRVVRPHKAGHAGTLDPLASGVVLVCVGRATRLIQYAQALRKSYRGVFLLGRRSESDDVEREVEVVAGAPVPTEVEVRQALARFRGEIMQRPPRHSAVKIEGRRAYRLARQGVEFEPAAKACVVHKVEVVRYAYPELELTVECGSGTYMRSLGRDVAESLGTHAVMAALERTAVGPFTVEAALAYDAIAENWEAHLQPPAMLTASLPAVTVTVEELRELQHGRPIGDRVGGAQAGDALVAAAHVEDACFAEIAAYDAAGNLVAILRQRAPGVLSAVRNFTQPS